MLNPLTGTQLFKGQIANISVIAVLIALMFFSSSPAHAQEENVIAVISEQKSQYLSTYTHAREILAEKGFKVQGYLLASLNKANLDALAKRPSVRFMAIGSQAARVLNKQLPRKLQLTYCMVSDPASHGLTHGRRIAGVSIDVPVRKQFDLIRQAKPATERVGMIYDSRNTMSKKLLEMAKADLPAGWELAAFDLAAFDGIPEAINALFNQPVDIVWTGLDDAVYNAGSLRALLLASIRNRVPVFGFSVGAVRAGALLGVGVTPTAQGRQLAELTAKRIPPPQMNRQQETIIEPEFEIAVNVTVSKHLRISLPASMMSTADHVFGK